MGHYTKRAKTFFPHSCINRAWKYILIIAIEVTLAQINIERRVDMNANFTKKEKYFCMELSITSTNTLCKNTRAKEGGGRQSANKQANYNININLLTNSLLLYESNSI